MAIYTYMLRISTSPGMYIGGLGPRLEVEGRLHREGMLRVFFVCVVHGVAHPLAINLSMSRIGMNTPCQPLTFCCQ